MQALGHRLVGVEVATEDVCSISNRLYTPSPVIVSHIFLRSKAHTVASCGRGVGAWNPKLSLNSKPIPALWFGAVKTLTFYVLGVQGLRV